MTVTTTTTTNTYTGDGTTTAFSFTFEILETTDIKVIVVTTATGVESVRSIGTGSTNYAVTGTGNVNGGTVTFVTAPTASETVFLMRNMSFTQPTDYRTNDPFPAETHENALDRMALQIQQIGRRLDRALLRPESDTTSGALPHNIDLKGGVLKFNSSSGVPEADSSLTDVATSSANGLMSSSDKAKLDGIEASATTDQTASEILSAIKTVDGASSGLDADLLDGQQGSYYLDASNFSGLGTVATLNVGIGNNNIPKFTSGVADNDFLKVDGSVIEGRSASEVVSDLGVITADSTTTLTNKTIDASQLSGTVADARLPASISSDITGNAATATLASTTTVSDSTANTNFPVVFHDESNGLLDDTGALRYNPSTGELLVPKLTVAGTTTTVDTVTMNAANAIIFEGATADAHETTLTITDPTADRTITLPNATGTVLLADGDGSSLTNVNATTLDSVDSTSFLRSDAADTKTSGDLTFSDDVKAIFGDGSDLSIRHISSSGHSIISESGSGNLFVRATNLTLDSADGEPYLRGIANGTVELYHDNSKKLETTSSGATVTGTAKATTAFQVDGASSGSGLFGVAVSSGGAKINADSGSDAATFIDFDATNISASGGDITYRFGRGTTEGSSDLSELIFYAHDGTNNPVIRLRSTGELIASSLDISGDVDVDGTLEADAMTLNGTAITSTATLSTGISNNNVPKFTSGVADNDFLKVDGTAIEGRSASEVLSDLAAMPLAGGTFTGNVEVGGSLTVNVGGGSVEHEFTGWSSSNTDIDGLLPGSNFGALYQVREFGHLVIGLQENDSNDSMAIVSGGGDFTSDTTYDTLIARFKANGDTHLNKIIATELDISGNGSITGDLTLTATDDSANSTPELKLVRHSASPSDFDYIGGLSFFADNSADENIEFGTIEARVRDVTDGTEDFNGFEFFGIKDGTARQRYLGLDAQTINFYNDQSLVYRDITSTHDLTISPPSSLSTSQTITLPDETGTVATREQLAGNATNGAGFVSDEIVTRGTISTGTNAVINRRPFSDNVSNANYLTAGSPQGGTTSQINLSSRQAYCLPITIPGTDADTTTNIDGFVFRTGFSGTINAQTMHIGLYTMNKYGYPSQRVSRASGSTPTTTNTRTTLTPDVTAIKPGRYVMVCGVFNTSNTNSFLVSSNFSSSTSAGSSFFVDGFSFTANNPQGRALIIEDALTDTSTVADVLPTSLASTTPTTFSSAAPLISFRLGTTYTGE